MNTPSQDCSKFLQPGLVHGCQVYQLEHWCHSRAHTGFLDVGHQFSRLCRYLHRLGLGSSFNFVPLALLYREARHFTWYLASCAIRSPPLSLANSRLSSSFRAHFLTLASSAKVETSCRVPLPACPSHKKHSSTEACGWSTF